MFIISNSHLSFFFNGISTEIGNFTCVSALGALKRYKHINNSQPLMEDLFINLFPRTFHLKKKPSYTKENCKKPKNQFAYNRACNQLFFLSWIVYKMPTRPNK